MNIYMRMCLTSGVCSICVCHCYSDIPGPFMDGTFPIPCSICGIYPWMAHYSHCLPPIRVSMDAIDPLTSPNHSQMAHPLRMSVDHPWLAHCTHFGPLSECLWMGVIFLDHPWMTKCTNRLPPVSSRVCSQLFVRWGTESF